MKVFDAEVVSNEEIAAGLRLLWLKTPKIGRPTPGQFLMVRCSDGIQPLLRRPLSIHRIDNTNRGSQGDLALLYSISGPGTSLLLEKGLGEKVNVIGPLGRGFSVHNESKNLLLVSDGWGISPLVSLADVEVKKGRSIVLLMGAKSLPSMYPTHLLPKEVELQVATEDGSSGRLGNVVSYVPEFWEWADEVFCSGPVSMYRSVADIARNYGFRKQVQVLADVSMACGIGACYGCTIRTRRGPRLVCKDGPCFNLGDLMF